MYRFFDMGLEAGVAAVILVPLFLVVNRIYFHDLGRTVGYLIFAIYLAGVDAVVGLPCITYIRLDFNYNFVPFLHMFSDYRSSLLNVLLFVPLGFFLPLFWKKFSAFGYTLLFGFCTSLLIELLQIFTFRATDINDLMTNTVGTVLGYLLARVVLKLFPRTEPVGADKGCVSRLRHDLRRHVLRAAVSGGTGLELDNVKHQRHLEANAADFCVICSSGSLSPART